MGIASRSIGAALLLVVSTGVPRRARQPRMLAGNVNLQREVLPNLVLMIAYAGSRGYNLVQAIEGNPAIPQILSDGTRFFPLDAPRWNPNWGSIEHRRRGDLAPFGWGGPVFGAPRDNVGDSPSPR